MRRLTLISLQLLVAVILIVLWHLLTTIPVGGKPLELLAGKELPAEQLKLARLLYDRVDEHVKYDKSKPGYGRGDVLWVCDSRFGNCTDFHSLFISLARAKGIPARFEIGFSVPEKRGEGPITGYHCWAFFWLEKQGWVPVDISEADKNPAMKEYYFGNLTAGLIALTPTQRLEEFAAFTDDGKVTVYQVPG